MKTIEEKRANEILINCMGWIDEVCAYDDLENTLKFSIGLTDEEIKNFGFANLEDK